MQKKINNVIEEAHSVVKQLLLEEFEHLYFHISPTGSLSCWVRNSEGKDGAGIRLEHKINIGGFTCFYWRYLQELNQKVALAHTNPKEYFYCTECGEVKSIFEFEANVFAGYYCKECAKKPDIASLIQESHKRGFYD